jgi:hypothetical protein
LYDERPDLHLSGRAGRMLAGWIDPRVVAGWPQRRLRRALDAGCCSPGITCSYIAGPPSASGGLFTEYCCDGNTLQWGIEAGFCPNGNTCGTIEASNYDQSCSTDSDCVGVPQGDLCDSSTCVNCVGAAINQSAQARYQSDLESRNSGVAEKCACLINGPTPVCSGGICTLGM